jgi:hypothetical protein
MERNAPSFVIQVTNGTGSVRQFASKAARCKARAAFELSASAAAVWPRRPGAWITAWPRLKWQRRARLSTRIALAEKLVAFCLDFLQIRKRPKTSHAPAIVAAWSLPLSTPSGKRLR